MIISKDIRKNEHFIKKGTPADCLYWLIKGRVVLLTDVSEVVLSGGSVIGLSDIVSESYQCDYVAVEDSKFYMVTTHNGSDLSQIYRSQKGYGEVFLLAVVSTTNQILREYSMMYQKADMFKRTSKEIRHILDTLGVEYGAPGDYDRMLDEALHANIGHDPYWQSAFYQEFASRPLPAFQAFFGGKESLIDGEIYRASNYTREVQRDLDVAKRYLDKYRSLFLAENQKDLTQVLLALARRIPVNRRQEILDTLSNVLAFAEVSGMYNDEQKDMLSDLLDEYAEKQEAQDAAQEEEGQKDPLTEILLYAECDMTREEEIRKLVADYRDLPDQTATDDDTRKLRRALTKAFYELYLAVVKKAVRTTEHSANISMFLNFGLLDESLAGAENTRILRELVPKLPLCKAKNVFTMEEWLRSIYHGENEPSKNEFDMDYEAFLREEKKNGNIRPEELEKRRKDQWGKVRFEVENMMRSNGRTTYGRVLTFCPALTEADLTQNPQNALVTAEKLKSALNEIEATDYTIFYHDVLFSDPEHGINSETVREKIYPNIILMPNPGVKAMMWQEAAGIRSNTPARFMFPIFLMSDLNDQMLITAGRYRWEYCRKVQGVRWNDVTEKSLTGQYCDYLQFYKKNRDLTPEAKEKLGQELTRVKNNYREVFVRDYISWMKYESKGSFRLNKITRDILIETCPLPKKIRESLLQNPTFGKKMERLNNMHTKDKKRLKMLIDRYKEAGGENLEPLERMIAFYDL